MQYYRSTQPANNSAHANDSLADTHTNTLISFDIISFPIVVLLVIITCKKYRAAVLRQQIATLEKIWLIKVKNNTYKQD